MSAFITLADARVAFEHLIVIPDGSSFVSLVNRAAERLSVRGATPGWINEVTLSTPDVSGYLTTTTADTAHIMAFKVNDMPYDIMPLSHTYKRDLSGTDSFVDMGYTSDTERTYRIPKELERDDTDYTSYVVTALVRPAYIPVASEADPLPFQRVDSLKLAAMAISYEDNSDIETAERYMTSALRERETDSREHRGPQTINIGVHDPAAYDSTHHFE